MPTQVLSVLQRLPGLLVALLVVWLQRPRQVECWADSGMLSIWAVRAVLLVVLLTALELLLRGRPLDSLWGLVLEAVEARLQVETLVLLPLSNLVASCFRQESLVPLELLATRGRVAFRSRTI